MAPATRYIHMIDGVDLNDGVSFACWVPETLTEFGVQVQLTEMEGRTPLFDRQQPVAGRFTLLLQMLFDTGAEYLARLATLRSLVRPGIHTYTRAQPGQDEAGQSVPVYFEGGLMVTDTDIGYCTAKAVAPDPTFT